MKPASLICFALAALTGISSVIQITKQFSAMQNTEAGVDYSTLAPFSVGACILPAALLILGLKLREKANAKAAKGVDPNQS